MHSLWTFIIFIRVVLRSLVVDISAVLEYLVPAMIGFWDSTGKCPGCYCLFMLKSKHVEFVNYNSRC